MRRPDSGLTVLECLFTVAVAGTTMAIVVPLTSEVLDEIRTASAARYLSGRIMAIRMDAVRRSTAVALRFETSPDDYVFTAFVDGNGNGIRTVDIRDGIDWRAGEPEQLSYTFRGVRFGLLEGTPDADGRAGSGTDGVRIGVPRILTMSPDGTATSGTLYIRGRRAQYAVRVLGVTGRTRVLQYRSGSRTWISR
ncbi:MAG TPA: hypothetical protein VLD67_17245 [Vicinamibacterales bacterium]|nr:hypothetical protein [Vicinamibacterales bacterium]